MKSIFQEYAEKKVYYRELIRSNLEIIFIELSRQSAHPAKPASVKGAYAQDRLEELMDLLEQHLASVKQVSKYASMLHLTAYQPGLS